MTISVKKQFTYDTLVDSIPRYPQRFSKEQFYPVIYPLMFMSRQMEIRIKELFRKGYVKGTVIISTGNEATSTAMVLPFRPGIDVLSLLQRDFSGHLASGATPYSVLCQYMANDQSPTHGKEGNVHHGNVKLRRFPMISHLGDMLSTVVGGVWAARRNGEDSLGLAVIGDGGSSTGDFHESINLASVQKSPVLFMIENNHYAYSTPTRFQYNCKRLSDRAAGYGIEGKTIDGTSAWEVYDSVCNALDTMQKTSLPYIIESMTLRLEGHAVYDNAEYVSAEEREGWMKREPLARAQTALKEVNGFTESEITAFENEITEEVNEVVDKALRCGRPEPKKQVFEMYAPLKTRKVPPFKASALRNVTAINAGLDYILSNNPNAFICGQDVGRYGSTFKTTKGLYEKYGPGRVVDFPICESAASGFCLGASQTGSFPVMEFQFADFATEAVTQIGFNAGTWFFRTDTPAPLLFRFPCGGGITMGAFHSGEYDGLWSRFPGLKILYPSTPQECFEAIVAGFYDPNPCLVFENKLLITQMRKSDIDFDGDIEKVFRPRKYTDGNDFTILASGAMIDPVLASVSKSKYTAEVWNPFILFPLHLDEILASVRRTGRFLVVQESGEAAGLGNNFISKVVRECYKELKCPPGLCSAPDNPVPFARELEINHIPGQDMIRTHLDFMIGA